MNKRSINTLIASAVALTIAGAAGSAMATEHEAASAKEKCYGVSKAGMNDCASLDGSHSCAGQAAEDGSANEWVALPAGTCDKLVNGTAGEISAEDADHSHDDAGEGESAE